MWARPVISTCPASTSGRLASWSSSPWWGCWTTWWVHTRASEHKHRQEKEAWQNELTWPELHLLTSILSCVFVKEVLVGCAWPLCSSCSYSVRASVIISLPRVTIPVSFCHIQHLISSFMSSSFLRSADPAESLPPRQEGTLRLPRRPSLLINTTCQMCWVWVIEPRYRREDEGEGNKLTSNL